MLFPFNLKTVGRLIWKFSKSTDTYWSSDAAAEQRNSSKMVKTFQAYLPPSNRTYSCVHCRAHLASHDELISKVNKTASRIQLSSIDLAFGECWSLLLLSIESNCWTKYFLFWLDCSHFKVAKEEPICSILCEYNLRFHGQHATKCDPFPMLMHLFLFRFIFEIETNWNVFSTARKINRVNVSCGQAEERVLLTGLHAVADIYCECCKTPLGWKYVSAECAINFHFVRIAWFHCAVFPIDWIWIFIFVFCNYLGARIRI